MTLRSLLFNVHRYVGLLAAIPLLLLAASGAILVFENELDRALNRNYWMVQPQSQRLPWQAVVDAAVQANPGQAATSLRPPPAADIAAEVSLKNGLMVSVDPYSGRVLGSRRREQILMAKVHQFHTKLLIGEWGSWITGVSALILAGLSLSGLVLWWRRKAFRFRWSGSWRRLNFDLHHSLGIAGLLFWLLLGLTGAAIAFEESVRPALYYLTRSEPNNVPRLLSTAEGNATRISVDDALAAAARALPDAETTVISLPKTPTETFLAFMKFPEDRTPAGRSRVMLDQYSGEVLWVENSRDTALGTRLWIKNRPLHTGDIFGWPTRLLACAACLALMIQVISGVWMWWPRRKAPKRDANES